MISARLFAIIWRCFSCASGRVVAVFAANCVFVVIGLERLGRVAPVDVAVGVLAFFGLQYWRALVSLVAIALFCALSPVVRAAFWPSAFLLTRLCSLALLPIAGHWLGADCGERRHCAL